MRPPRRAPCLSLTPVVEMAQARSSKGGAGPRPPVDGVGARAGGSGAGPDGTRAVLRTGQGGQVGVTPVRWVGGTLSSGVAACRVGLGARPMPPRRAPERQQAGRQAAPCTTSPLCMPHRTPEPPQLNSHIPPCTLNVRSCGSGTKSGGPCEMDGCGWQGAGQQGTGRCLLFGLRR